jgi:aspartate 1-decarboxylase
MLISVLKSKLHQARITAKNIEYSGSLSVDERLMKAVGLVAHEKVVVANIRSGTRFETYVIPAPAESGIIGLNGAAARLGETGDEIIVMSFALVTPDEQISPRVAILDGQNRIVGMK